MSEPVDSTRPKGTNRIGLLLQDYKGKDSTLCAGCGHDAITSQIIKSFFEYGVEPHRVVKLSGIGCSSKTPTYFLSRSYGFNAVHGRMPAIATGAMLRASRSMSARTCCIAGVVPTSRSTAGTASRTASAFPSTAPLASRTAERPSRRTWPRSTGLVR